jgi:hypothetical protein
MGAAPALRCAWTELTGRQRHHTGRLDQCKAAVRHRCQRVLQVPRESQRRRWCRSLWGRRQKLVDGGGEPARVGDRKAVPEAGQPGPQPGQASGRTPVLLVVR